MRLVNRPSIMGVAAHTISPFHCCANHCRVGIGDWLFTNDGATVSGKSIVDTTYNNYISHHCCCMNSRNEKLQRGRKMTTVGFWVVGQYYV